MLHVYIDSFSVGIYFDAICLVVELLLTDFSFVFKVCMQLFFNPPYVRFVCPYNDRCYFEFKARKKGADARIGVECLGDRAPTRGGDCAYQLPSTCMRA